MGGIDLDPASSDAAQRHVLAADYYTAARNGLAQQWSGRVWLNPPYAMPFIKQFTGRMCHAARTGEISEGILLTNSAPDTRWFHMAMEYADALCHTRGRIRFLESKDGQLIERPAPMLGQTFFYFGMRRDKFSDIFSEFGHILVSL